MKEALVTGGAGFLGSHLASRLSTRDNCQATILDNLSGGFRENVPDDVSFVNGSINDKELVSQLFEENDFDYVYHLAAYAAEGLSPFIRRYNYKNNLLGSVNLINCSVKHDIDCFVFTSSIAVYGDSDVPMKETMTPNPEDPYGIAKYAVEMDLKEASERFGLQSVIFRPHNIYGENQNIGDKYRNVVGIFMNQIMKSEPMYIFGDGTQKRAFTYVDDIIPCIARSAWTSEAYNNVFNIGADENYTINELAKHVAQAMGKPNHPIEYVKERDEVKIAYCDHTKVRKVFGPLPETRLSEGLEQMAAWARRVGARESSDFTEIEIEQGLPPIWK